MIGREPLKPLKPGVNDGRVPDKPVRRNLGAGCSDVPVVARLPAALERRIAGVEEPAYGRYRVKEAEHGAIERAADFEHNAAVAAGADD